MISRPIGKPKIKVKEIITTKIFNPRPEKIDKKKVEKTKSLNMSVLGHFRQKK
jgi:hypothetical protein